MRQAGERVRGIYGVALRNSCVKVSRTVHIEGGFRGGTYLGGCLMVPRSHGHVEDDRKPEFKLVFTIALASPCCRRNA